MSKGKLRYEDALEELNGKYKVPDKINHLVEIEDLTDKKELEKKSEENDDIEDKMPTNIIKKR